jgi:hypothetical protein
MRFVRCDNCGKDQQDPYRNTYEERERLLSEQSDKVIISLEHNEDVQNFDACSWECVAALALKQSAENAIDGLGAETYRQERKEQ